MDRSFRNVLQKIVNESDENKAMMISRSLSDLMPIFRKIDDDTDGAAIVFGIMSGAVGADGKLSGSEVAVVSAVMKALGVSWSTREIVDMITGSNLNQAKKLLVRLSGVLGPEEKASLITMVAAVCAIDDRISHEEVDLLESLL